MASISSATSITSANLDLHDYIDTRVDDIPEINSKVTLAQFMSVLICPTCLKQNAYTYSFCMQKVSLKELDLRKLKILQHSHWKHVVSCYLHFLNAPFVNHAFSPQFKSLVSTFKDNVVLSNSPGLREALRQFQPVLITESLHLQWKRCINLYHQKEFNRVLEKNDSVWMKYVSSQGYKRRADTNILDI